MSYATFSEKSDIYLYSHGIKPLIYECISCSLDPDLGRQTIVLIGTQTAITHVQSHIAKGDKVEDDVIPLLRKELLVEAKLNG